MGKSREIRSLGQMRRKDCFLYSDCRIFRQSVLNQRSEQVGLKPCSPAAIVKFPFADSGIHLRLIFVALTF